MDIPVSIDRKLSVAPMMGYTDRHFRYLLRLLSRHTILYTEMLTTGALLHGDRQGLLLYHPDERPLALQLGGNNPDDLQQCTRIAEQAGFDEVNLNIGCPSDRVQQGHIGACLMSEPELVADCVSAMQAQVSIPVTVKTRTGIDNMDSYEHLARFIRNLSDAGCNTFIIHARKAWLDGLSPKQNRDVPPLQYGYVHRLKKDFPHLVFVVNGGFSTMQEVQAQLQYVDGVMIGRAACRDPYLLAAADQWIYDSNKHPPTRAEVLLKYCSYVQSELENGVALNRMTRHILGLFSGQAGARAYRRVISEQSCLPGAGIEVIKTALRRVQTG